MGFLAALPGLIIGAAGSAASAVGATGIGGTLIGAGDVASVYGTAAAGALGLGGAAGSALATGIGSAAVSSVLAPNQRPTLAAQTPLPNPNSAAVEAARQAAQAAAVSNSGASATRLTGPLGVTSSSPVLKTVLG